MKADKLKGTKQITFCQNLLDEGKSRKEVVEALMKEFNLSRRTSTTYVYLWFRGDDYKVVKPKNVTKKESLSQELHPSNSGVAKQRPVVTDVVK